MKKSGVLNSAVSAIMASLDHGDGLVIADAGFGKPWFGMDLIVKGIYPNPSLCCGGCRVNFVYHKQIRSLKVKIIHERTGKMKEVMRAHYFYSKRVKM
ncbi:MAG: hypothetical protein M1371_08250 [Actinobacteria bacterium]|nr:hypothetical protein [Actinomycetota bacterium]